MLYIVYCILIAIGKIIDIDLLIKTIVKGVITSLLILKLKIYYYYYYYNVINSY